MINPCGLGSDSVTSLEKLGVEIDYSSCCRMLADKICEVFDCQMEWVSEDAFATMA